jgi:hypothetical protein
VSDVAGMICALIMGLVIAAIPVMTVLVILRSMGVV